MFDKIIKNPEDKWKRISILSISFAMSFMVFFFVPVDLFLHNPTDFIVSLNFLLLPWLICALSGFAILSAILFLLNGNKLITGVIIIFSCGLILTIERLINYDLLRIFYLLVAIFLALIWVLLIKIFKEKAIDIALLMLWGVFVMAYAQMLFLNGAMSAVDGNTVEYSNLSFMNIVNILVWLLISFLPLGIWIVLRLKNKEFKYGKLLIFTAALVSGMQIVGLLSTVMTTKIPEGLDKNPGFFAYEHALRFNPDDNIIVFIVDTLDTEYMIEALAEYPDLYGRLDGFTFYKNNISEYLKTFPSVTTMLTQHHDLVREGLTFDEFWKEAWERHTFIDALKENGYTSNLFIDKQTTYGSIDDIKDRADNLEIPPLEINVGGTAESLKSIAFLSLTRLTPYLFKDIFLSRHDTSFGNHFFDADYSRLQNPSIWNESDINFYKFIKENDFSADSQNKVFTIVHLNFSHGDKDTSGYHYDAEADAIFWGGSYLDSTYAGFEILNVYFSKMKEIGVYDNSTIILIADHSSSWEPSTASLLLKEKNAAGVLKIDSETEFSNKYFAASVLEAAGIPHDEFGISYFDILRGECPGGGTLPDKRYWHQYSDWVNGIPTMNDIYEVTGDANNLDNWSKVK
jgi:hypothetical protein